MEKKIVPVPSLQESVETILDFLTFCVRSALPDVTDAQVKDVWDKLMTNNNKIIERLQSRKLEKGSLEEKEYTRAKWQIQRSRVPIVSVEQIQKWKFSQAVTKEIDGVLRGLAGQGSPLKSLSEDLLAALPLELLSHMDLSFADLVRLSRTSKELYNKIMADPSILIEEQVTYVPGMKPWLKKLKNIRLERKNLGSLKNILKVEKVNSLVIDFREYNAFVFPKASDARYIEEAFQNNLPLHTLKIHAFPIKDISALANLKTLRVLDLSASRQIEDISALAHMKELRVLNLHGTRVRDITALKDTPLRLLNLNNTPVVDISTLDVSNLYSLNLSATEVKDISVLADAHKLHTLRLYLTQVDNIDVLGNIPDLYDLEIPLSVEDISALTNAHKLHSLRYDRNLDVIEPTLEKIPSLKIFKTGHRIYTRKTNMWGTNYWKFEIDESD